MDYSTIGLERFDLWTNRAPSLWPLSGLGLRSRTNTLGPSKTLVMYEVKALDNREKIFIQRHSKRIGPPSLPEFESC